MYDIPQFSDVQTRKIGKDKYEAYHGTDDDLIVSFEKYPVYLEHKSKLEGRKLYEERDHIRIQFPADRTREIFRPVKTEWDNAGPPDAERFPRQWAAWQNQASAVQAGTLLQEWPHVNKAQVLELKAMNIVTVEHLAAVTDSTLHTLGMGARELRDKAKTWLDRTREDATLSSVMARLEALEAENRALREGVNVPAEAEARQESFVPVRKPPASAKRAPRSDPAVAKQNRLAALARARAARSNKHSNLAQLQEGA